MEPVTIIATAGIKPIVLGQNRQLVDLLDGAAGLVEEISSHGVFQNDGWRIVKRGEVTY